MDIFSCIFLLVLCKVQIMVCSIVLFPVTLLSSMFSSLPFLTPCSHPSLLFSCFSSEPPAAVNAPGKSFYNKPDQQTPCALHPQCKRPPQADEHPLSSIGLDHRWPTVLRTSSSVCVDSLVQSYSTVLLLVLMNNNVVLLRNCAMDLEAVWKAWLSLVFRCCIFLSK